MPRCPITMVAFLALALHGVAPSSVLVPGVRDSGACCIGLHNVATGCAPAILFLGGRPQSSRSLRHFETVPWHSPMNCGEGALGRVVPNCALESGRGKCAEQCQFLGNVLV